MSGGRLHRCWRGLADVDVGHSWQEREAQREREVSQRTPAVHWIQVVRGHGGCRVRARRGLACEVVGEKRITS